MSSGTEGPAKGTALTLLQFQLEVMWIFPAKSSDKEVEQAIPETDSAGFFLRGVRRSGWRGIESLGKQEGEERSLKSPN